MNKTESNWPQLVGAFITNFGAAEMAAFGWITKLSADPVVLRDLAIEMPFKKRISLVCELIVRSRLPTEQKEKAVTLWKEVAKLAETRNVIAHNPFATTAQGDSGFLDVKKLKGDGPYELIPLRLTDLADAGSRLTRILPDLLQPVSRNES